MREACRVGAKEDVCDLPVGDGAEKGRGVATILQRDDGGLAVQLALTPFTPCGGIPPPEGRQERSELGRTDQGRREIAHSGDASAFGAAVGDQDGVVREQPDKIVGLSHVRSFDERAQESHMLFA